MVIGLAVAALLLTTGATWQIVASKRDRERLPPPGWVIDVGDTTLHVVTRGTYREGEPTVILEAGSTSFSAQWPWIQGEVARFAHVVAYDRAGLGWSAGYDGLHDAQTLATHLERLLDQMRIEGPYILVGHSFGSFISRVFADRHRDGGRRHRPPERRNETLPARFSRCRGTYVPSPRKRTAGRFRLIRLPVQAHSTASPSTSSVPPPCKASCRVGQTTNSNWPHCPTHAKAWCQFGSQQARRGLAAGGPDPYAGGACSGTATASVKREM